MCATIRPRSTAGINSLQGNIHVRSQHCRRPPVAVCYVFRHSFESLAHSLTGTNRAGLVADNSSSPVQTVSARALSCCRHRTRLPQDHATSCIRTCVSEGTPIGHEQRHGRRATLSAQVRRTYVQHRSPESVEQYSCHTKHCCVQKEPENIFIS